MRLGSPWCALALLLACGDDADLARDDNPAGALDAAVPLDGSRPARREDARVDAGPPTLDAAAPESCQGALAPPAVEACMQPDPSEPNDTRAPAMLTLDDSCALVLARAADKDEDAYRVRAQRADPIAIDLAYRDDARADLSFSVFRGNQRILRQAHARTRGSELESTIFMSSPETLYDVRVEGTQIGTCVPYALRVDANWCSDAYEDNDSAHEASELDLSGGAVELTATGSKFEADYYAFAPTKADPVLVSGSYEVDATSNLQLRRVLSNVTGLNAIDDPGQRMGTSERWQHWLRSDTPRYIVQIAPSGDGCATYRLRVDPAACSDPFEDNDRADSATPLAFGESKSGSAFAGDDDFFALPVANGGRCTLSYQPVGAQQLRIDVHSAASGVIASALGKPGVPNVTVAWSGVATVIDVRAQLANDCQPYVLRCDVTSPQ